MLEAKHDQSNLKTSTVFHPIDRARTIYFSPVVGARTIRGRGLIGGLADDRSSHTLQSVYNNSHSVLRKQEEIDDLKRITLYFHAW